MRRPAAPLVALTLVLASAALVAGGCRVFDPPFRPEATCARACAQKAPQCSEDACLRGCNFALDRVIERETKAVLACLAKQKACDDPVWARCSVTVGEHADGGPPAPPPPKDYDDDDTAPAKKNDDTDLD